ncbi:MAG: hypothetical protein Q8S58_01185 [Bosea sp. (in: a-proteobacteria)]|uniref:hypothetical protein n=1 Tax=Bosea sp. (in: a-proteobacteria) TaxID=1871050 RepID=UPI0027344E50|nr:hypothetical protein [Bosea sp. (in: a-proteobacteria)]MDP3258525.1 hypothetical protein [Bosea sp. (in: a-proteobacteria)]MDP3317716.1 hypothetical protein [Bosea sp. (in: a-proteobacteria)]
MFRSLPGLALAAVLSAVTTVAMAQPQGQTTTKPAAPAEANASGGLGPVITNPTEIDKGQNMILPNAGVSHPSAAPTMVYDCKNKPQDCITPTNPGDKADLPDTSATPPTSKP